MKKVVSLLIIIAVIFAAIVAVGMFVFNQALVTNGDFEITTSEELISLVNKIYEVTKADEELPMLETNEIDVANIDMVTSFTGLTDASKLDKLVVSEPMMSSRAYSLVLLTVKDEVDADAIAKEMSEKVDTRKWICVQAEQLYTLYSGNTVCLVMTDKDIADKIRDAFKTETNALGREYSVENSMDDIELPPEMF